MTVPLSDIFFYPFLHTISHLVYLIPIQLLPFPLRSLNKLLPTARGLTRPLIPLLI
jgi:hypothetical protein